MLRCKKILFTCVFVATNSVALTSLSMLSYAGESADQAKKLETVIDKLEQKLLDHEASPLSDDEALKTGTQEVDVSPKKYQPLKSKKISASPAANKNLRELEKKLNEYEHRIELLESEIRRLRSSVHENSTTDNRIRIDVTGDGTSKFIIKTLFVKFDGKNLYNQQNSAGLWMPSNEISVMDGPVQPGDHKLEVQATIVPIEDSGLPLPKWKHLEASSEFKLSVPAGKYHRKMLAVISTDKETSSKPQIKLVEVQ